MKTLKESILSRSSHTGESFKTKRRNEIAEWLTEHDIKNYTIKDDFSIDVNGNVNLELKDLTELPDHIQFGVVNGYFTCSFNQLTTLRGVPRIVRDSFDCSFNDLDSLEGAPKKVGGFFDCSGNQLTSLEGVPKKVKNFNCSNNKLISLEGAPRKVSYKFDCSYNKLISLKGAPKEVGEYFICSENLTTFTEEDVRKVCNVEGAIVI